MRTALLLAALLVAASSAHKGVFHSFHQSFDPNVDTWEKIDKKTFSTAKFPWQAPRPGDVRSSCPFLSTCANHGILPRDGKNIHFEQLYRCAHFGGFGKTMFRISRASFSKIVATFRLQDIKRSTDAADRGQKLPIRPNDRISLDETSLHGPIEHDLSFTRLDVALTPNIDLHQTGRRDLNLVKGLFAYATKRPGCKLKITDQWLMNEKCGQVDPECYLDVDDMGAWHQERNAMEEERHKALGRPIEFGIREMTAACGEASFLVHLIGRDGKVPLEHARIFLVFERIPDDWKPPKTMHFPQFVPRLVSMMSSYRKKRKGPTASKDEELEEDRKKLSDKDVFNILVRDRDGNGCSGDEEDACPTFEAVKDE